jgi:replicative DNA helicase
MAAPKPLPANVIELLPENLRNYEAEQALLGAILQQNPCWFKVCTIAAPEHFADPFHGRIYAAAGRMIEAGQLANAITLKAEIDTDPAMHGVNKSYAQIIASSVVTIINIEDYAVAIRDLWMRRQMIERCQEIITTAQSSFDQPADETALAALNDMNTICRTGRPTGISKKRVAEQIVEGIMQPPPRFETGITALDSAMAGGFYAGKLYGFGARKKTGKTTLLATFSHNLDYRGTRNSFFAGEMSPTEIEHKNAARALGINPIAFLKRPDRALASRVAEYAADLYETTLYESIPGITLDQLTRKMSQHIIQHGSRVIFIDYWQIIQGRRPDDSQEQHQARVAQLLADFARRNNVAIVIAAQLNQEGNSRGGEGIKLACDCYFVLHREKGDKAAWLEMEESRYVPYTNVGKSSLDPGLWLHLGSHFSDEAPSTAHFNEEE